MTISKENNRVVAVVLTADRSVKNNHVDLDHCSQYKNYGDEH